MTNTPKDPVDETGSFNVGLASRGVPLTRINPDKPTMQAVVHLRFWQRFSDKQIQQVLTKSVTEIEENHHS